MSIIKKHQFGLRPTQPNFIMKIDVLEVEHGALIRMTFLWYACRESNLGSCDPSKTDTCGNLT